MIIFWAYFTDVKNEVMNTTPNALFKSSILLKFKLGRNLIPIDSTHLLRVEKKNWQIKCTK